MARTTSFDGAFEDMPLSFQRAALADRSYYPQAACRSVADTPKLAFTAEPNRQYEIGNETYEGETLVELALQVCCYCPVQWDCASTAIEAGEMAGTWSAAIDDIRFLARTCDNGTELIALARSTGVPMQRAIKMLRDGLT